MCPLYHGSVKMRHLTLLINSGGGGSLFAGHQGSSLSDPHKTTGFGPFKLPTRGPLQKGRDHSPPKACFEEPSTRNFFNFFIFPVLSLHIFSLFSYV